MGTRWQAGQLWYQDCDHCGLSYREDGMLRKDHEDGSCVSAFGTKEDKKGYGADTQSATWRTSGLKVSIVGPDLNEASRRVVEAPVAPPRADPVETGWA
jgi:hypothetical protein